MVGRFSSRAHSRVTTAATPGYARVVHECDRAPCGRCMAICTEFAADNVSGRLGRGLNEPCRRMTADTFGDRVGEGCAGMAAVAGNREVGTVQCETGAEVIKRFRSFLRLDDREYTRQSYCR